MIKIGRYYVHKEDISYLDFYERSDNKYDIEFVLKSSDKYFNYVMSKEEFEKLQKLLIVESDEDESEKS